MSVDKNVKAAMARSFKREAKEQEKQDKRRENERKEEQKRAELKPAKEKWTKTITTTQSRKRAREKAGYADEDLAGSSEVVWKQKGSEAGKNIPAMAAAFDVLAFLKQRADYEEASLGDIREGTGIDLNAHATLLEHLRGNIKVEAVEEPGAPLRLRYMPAHGVRDRNSLLHLLKHTYPGAPEGHVESLPRSELPAEETFQEVGEAIDELIQSGRCSVVERADKLKLPDSKKQVLFAPVELLLHPLVCTRASEAMRNLWHGEDLLGDKEKASSFKEDMVVPKGRDLEELLLKRKVRTADQLERRKERHKAAAERRKQEQEEAARRKKRGPTFRTVSNAHVADLFGGHELRGQALEDANRRAAQLAQSQR
mmetsp:Transcript_14494/g.35954  ORF Transcript_14494/g.35954 Transcript_14494/m.35954 type:complete len:369 (-) Transcript_14494:270-1376(-)